MVYLKVTKLSDLELNEKKTYESSLVHSTKLTLPAVKHMVYLEKQNQAI
jgi:hypothetical protein